MSALSSSTVPRPDSINWPTNKSAIATLDIASAAPAAPWGEVANNAAIGKNCANAMMTDIEDSVAACSPSYEYQRTIRKLQFWYLHGVASYNACRTTRKTIT